MTELESRAIVRVGSLAIAVAVGTNLLFGAAGSKPTRAPTAVPPDALPSDRAVAASRQATLAPATDPVATYAAMRDDVNPRPRRQMIDAWARTAVAGADSDLLGMALVDPDESVRARAPELYVRRLALH